MHDDGSFTIKRILVMENPIGMLGSGFADLGSDSSPSENAKPKVDSTSQKFIVPKKAFAKLKGILSYKAIDSSNDSMIIAGVEIHLKDTTSLSAVHDILWKSTDSLKKNTGKEFPDPLPDSNASLPEFTIKVSRISTRTTLTCALPPPTASSIELPAKLSKKMLRGILAMFGVYIRVFSDHLAPTTETCQIESKPGYQQWRVPLETVFDPDYGTHTTMQFVVDTAH